MTPEGQPTPPKEPTAPADALQRALKALRAERRVARRWRGTARTLRTANCLLAASAERLEIDLAQALAALAAIEIRLSCTTAKPVDIRITGDKHVH